MDDASGFKKEANNRKTKKKKHYTTVEEFGVTDSFLH